MDQIVQFFYEGDKSIRSITIDGEPWFVAKDVCEIFGDTNYRRSIARLEDDEKGVSPFDTPGGRQNLSVISESGLYAVLFNMQPQQRATISEVEFQNRVESLRKFKRWITHEVIPSIRRHGAYLTPSTIEEVLLNPDTIIKIATQLKVEQEERKRLEAQVIADRPKVLFAEALEVSDNAILIGELAKILKQNGINIGPNRLFEQLRQDGYLMRARGDQWNDPTQYAMELGLFEIILDKMPVKTS